MGPRSKTVRYFVATLFFFFLTRFIVCAAQVQKPKESYPVHLPYSFGNLVWWSDDELRALLKKRIAGLGDEIATTGLAEGRLRDALTALLKEKGVAAEVQSEEPSFSSFGAQRDPEAAGPSIRFSILHPSVLVDKVNVLGAPENLSTQISAEMKEGEGKPYSAFGDWYIRSRLKSVLGQNGYLDAKVQVSRELVDRVENNYLVGMQIAIDARQQYRISGLDADGGPLLAGKDLSRFFGKAVGDVAGRDPFENLRGNLWTLYRHFGYADVEIESNPQLDRAHAQVAYRLAVNPGPIYQLRKLSVEKLDAAQEARVRELIGMKPGDVYQDDAIANLYRKIVDEPLLKGYSFSFGPKRDKEAHAMDLTLSFFKDGNESRLTIK
jgi:outer membrane protein assembly factor BamA